jgi:hypothetical protein
MIDVRIVREAFCRMQVACELTFRRAMVSRAIYREYDPAGTESRIRALSSLGRGVRLGGAQGGTSEHERDPTALPFESMYL